MLMKNTIMAKARAMANIMSPRGDIAIRLVKHGQPYATKDAIHIPEGDWGDLDYLAKVEWYINHELGHIQFTIFDAVKDVFHNKLLASLTNSIAL